MGDRCLTQPKLQRSRELETQSNSAFVTALLYSRDKEEDSGKKEARKATARRKSGNIRMESLHRDHNDVTAQGTSTYVDGVGVNAQAISRDVLKSIAITWHPGPGIAKTAKLNIVPLERNGILV